MMHMKTMQTLRVERIEENANQAKETKQKKKLHWNIWAYLVEKQSGWNDEKPHFYSVQGTNWLFDFVVSNGLQKLTHESVESCIV